MKQVTINKYTGENVDFLIYPDGQPHVRVKNIQEGDTVDFIWPIRNPLELLQFCMVSDAVTRVGAWASVAHIPYLMGARSDKMTNPGDSLDLSVICKILDHTPVETVVFYDVHNPGEVERCMNFTHVEFVTNRDLVRQYCGTDAVFICPDKGAVAKSDQYRAWNPSITDTVYCEKSRDAATGRVTLRVLEPEKCADRDCVIIDDICDGGATFLAIADQIKPKRLVLVVTHGIFSKGLATLESKFDEILCTDSYQNPTAGKKLHVLPLKLLTVKLLTVKRL